MAAWASCPAFERGLGVVESGGAGCRSRQRRIDLQLHLGQLGALVFGKLRRVDVLEDLLGLGILLLFEKRLAAVQGLDGGGFIRGRFVLRMKFVLRLHQQNGAGADESRTADHPHGEDPRA